MGCTCGRWKSHSCLHHFALQQHRERCQSANNTSAQLRGASSEVRSDGKRWKIAEPVRRHWCSSGTNNAKAQNSDRWFCSGLAGELWYPFSLPRASKNGTGKNNASGEQVEKPRLLKFAATVGGFLRWAQTDTVRGWEETVWAQAVRTDKPLLPESINLKSNFQPSVHLYWV